MSAEHVALVRRQLEAYNARDWDTAYERIDPDVEWVVAREHPASRTLRGLGEIRAYHQDWLGALAGLRLEIDEIADRGDTVISVGRIRGTGDTSGAEVVVPIAFVTRFRDDRVVRVEEYLDPQEALQTSARD